MLVNNKSKKSGTVIKWLNRISTIVMFSLLIGIIGILFISKSSGVEPNLFSYQLKVVLSGSMEPDIQTGSIIAVKMGGDMSRFMEGDVITFREENKSLVTHRITELIQLDGQVAYQTKGDNNDGVDLSLVSPEKVTAEYTGITIPYVGYGVGFLQSKTGALAVIFTGVLLLLYSLYTMWTSLVNAEVQRRTNKIIAEDGIDS